MLGYLRYSSPSAKWALVTLPILIPILEATSHKIVADTRRRLSFPHHMVQMKQIYLPHTKYDNVMSKSICRLSPGNSVVDTPTLQVYEARHAGCHHSVLVR